MAGLGDIFNPNGMLYQVFIYGFAQQIITALAGPYFSDLGQLVNEKNPVIPLSPPDLAQAVVRGFMTSAAATDEAAKSGMSKARFAAMVKMAGDAPAPGDLAIALRRGVINYDTPNQGLPSFIDGIREGRLADIWAPMMRDLSQQWPTPADALAAVLEGQVPIDEGKTLYQRFGGDPAYFQLLYDTRGNAPTPTEALTMANRGIIPWSGTGPQVVSYEQAFLEGPWRNKWLKPYEKLGTYIPPERTVSTLLSKGAITSKQAAGYWASEGMDQETITAFIRDAVITGTESTKGLTEATVLDMYYQRFITKADATSILSAMHVSTQHADLLLAYTDIKRAIAAVNNAVTRIQTLYIGHKITRDTARNDLNTLKIPPAEIQNILQTWDLEVSTNVKTLTESQIVDSWEYSIMTADEALTELQNIGYTPYDAWVVLSVKAKGALPGKPAKGPAPPMGSVIPGTTG